MALAAKPGMEMPKGGRVAKLVDQLRNTDDFDRKVKRKYNACTTF
jgi:hypothetical protein